MERGILSALLLCAFCLVVASVSADTPAPPFGYSKATQDGRHLFVMLSPLSGSFDSEGAALRETYGTSGLYPMDDSTEPIWTVDWYARDVEALSDGVHLVRPGPWAGSPNDEAVSFFAGGTRIRSYTVGDLVAYPQLLPHSVSHFTWRADTELYDQARQYRITTLHGERYTFDVTSGEIVSSFSPYPWLVAVGVAIGAAGCALSFRWWRRRARR